MADGVKPEADFSKGEFRRSIFAAFFPVKIMKCGRCPQ